MSTRYRQIAVRVAAALAVALALGVALACSYQPLENVVLISIDSLRADRLGCYGNVRPTSPTMDRLAREGALFERAYSPTPWTLPAHATLLSGQLPHRHGTVDWSDVIPETLPLLQEGFARRGHETLGIYSGPFLHPHFGFARGFDAYLSCMSFEVDASGPRLRSILDSHEDRTNEAVEKALRGWIQRREGQARSFFIFLHLWDVHFDYIAPEPYATMFDGSYDGRLDGRHIVDEKGFPRDASPRDIEHLMALYDGELRYTDDTIGHMLEALDRAGLLERTLVVITSDHGEEFREHGGKTHHRAVYAESVHVPLILWAKTGLPRGLRVRDPVSLADVAPTIADLTGLEPLAPADGRSLVPALRGEPLPTQPVLSAMFLPGLEFRRTLAVRYADRTLILSKREWQRFDPTSDPGEKRPEPLQDGPDRATLEAFDAEVVATLARRPANAGGAPSGPGSAPPSEVTERLRALGYLH